MIAMTRQTSTAAARIAAIRSNGANVVVLGAWKTRRGFMRGCYGEAGKPGFWAH
ncbi:hypothetical protein [Rubrimonas cliftonensis]|uniref:Uncharacterized protein n=1 Tax=Rubrimonas cliftonensis TaxID=89524 RepID=A0A1H3Z5Z7_9RHOB|nr:hypothetical protein [Rubrimonas cliftonensis]SEA19263.1 hypothetical protein SAMN05444370_103412 [Rubrimonas cliftonensis]